MHDLTPMLDILAAETLTGKGGNDYLEGGQDFDTHLLSAGNEGWPANDAVWKEVA